MAPGIAGAPDADTNGINFGLALEKRNRAPPIGDLLPRVDIPALYPVAGPETAMIMDQHDETGFREGACESFYAMLLHAGIAVRHRNRRRGAFGVGNEQPTAQRHAALDPELDIPSFRHCHLLFSLCLPVVDPVSVRAIS